MQQLRFRTRYVFKFLIKRSLLSVLLPAHYYTITTKTGAQYQGGTDGKVFARLIGDRGSTDKIQLTSSNLPAGTQHFKAGQ